MSQHEERARAVKQARKLMEMTTAAGASETEAEFAMNRLNDIQAVFNLTLDEIVLETLEYKAVEKKAISVRGCIMERLAVPIAKFTNTKVWRTPGIKKFIRARNGKLRATTTEESKYTFFGLEADIQMADFLYDYLASVVIAAEQEFKKSDTYLNITYRGDRKSASSSFRKGMIARLSVRIVDLVNSREERASSLTGNDIVLCKSAVREKKYQEQFGMKLVAGRKTYSHASNWSAWDHGRSAGDKVNLNRPIDNTAKTMHKLTHG